MNKLQQKGFAALEALLVVVAVGVIGGIGWYTYSSKQKTDKILNQADKISQNTPIVKKTNSAIKNQSVPTAGDTTAKSADGKFEVTLPSGWKIANRIDGGQKCGFSDPSAGGSCISDISFQDGSGKLDSYVKIFKSSMSPGEWYNSVFGSCSTDNRDITVNSNPGIQCDQDGNIENIIASGSYVAYFYGPDSSSENTLVRSTQFL